MKKIFTLTMNLVIMILCINGQAQPAKEKCIPCEKLLELKLPDVKITGAVEATEGSLHCMVTGIIGKEIKFELLLPDRWNGIYVMGGGGGFVGVVQNSMRSTVNDGYATSGTDTGHPSDPPDWALDNMERQLNFGHLAIHRTAEVSKAIIGNYYGYYPEYSYFLGCSRGGGQAMMEAQRYPEDFNGIVAAAPAFNWPAIGSEMIQNTQAVYPEGLTRPLFTEEHIRILNDAVLKQFDLKDGVRDSIIDDPGECNFDFNSLPKCKDDKPGKGCFTSAQINALKKIYGGIQTVNGISYPGFPVGGENETGSWKVWITGTDKPAPGSAYPSLQSYFGIEMFRYLILQDPNWDYRTYDFKGYEKELRYASAYLDATSTDYSGLKNRNGKIIFWHGWNDPALSALATIEHYNGVKAKDPDIENYMRLFLLPGVLHCGGGEGPSGADWLALIRNWVEKGQAPERIVVTKKSKGVLMSRPVYPYPRKVVWDGKGDINKESSFLRK